jgi:HAD superfamily hydrolase (TIGR01509 family)
MTAEKPRVPRAVVFDCDGTLLDSMGMWHQSEAQLARDAGHELTDAEKDLLRAATLFEAASWFYEELGVGESPADVVAMIEGAAVRFYTERAEAKPGVLAFVERLHAAGVPMAVASSSPHSMLDPGLARAGLAPYFKAVVSTDDVGAPKREPAVYDRAREACGEADPGATWVFEDAVYALRTAGAAGYRRVGIYDTDEAGTLEALSAESDAAFARFADIDVERFLAGGYAR